MAFSGSTVTPSAVASTSITTSPGWQQQHPVRIGTEHILGTSGRPARLVPHVGRCGDARSALPRRQLFEQLGMGLTDDQRGQRRGGNGTRHHRRGGLVDHRAQVVDGAARAAMLLGKRDAEDPQLGHALVGGAPRVGLAAAPYRARPGPQPSWMPSYVPARVRQTARQ